MHRILIIAKNKNFPKRIGDRPPFHIHPAIEQRMEALPTDHTPIPQIKAGAALNTASAPTGGDNG